MIYYHHLRLYAVEPKVGRALFRIELLDNKLALGVVRTGVTAKRQRKWNIVAVHIISSLSTDEIVMAAITLKKSSFPASLTILI